MPTSDSLIALVGKRVAPDVTPAADSALVPGMLLGKIDSADGPVLIVEPDEAPGTRRSVHSHHVTKAHPV